MAETISILLSEEEVDSRIQKMGEMISKDYEGKQIHLICVLKGGVFFMCELAKRISVPVSMDFMAISSYGSDTKSSGVIKIVKDLDESITGKDVLVVEDIVDTGITMRAFMSNLREMGATSVALTSFLYKPESLRYEEVKPKYYGLAIPPAFIIGYGLDINEKARNLDAIYSKV